MAAGVELIVSDDHSGLGQARRACFGGAKWQRCQFHLSQNALHYVPRVSMRAEVAADLRTVFNAPNRLEAARQLRLAVDKYSQCAPELAHWMESNVPEGLTVFELPAAHRR